MAEVRIAEADPLRQPYVEKLRQLDAQAKDLAEFEKIPMKIKGVVIGENAPPAVLINDMVLGEGDPLAKDLIIRSIRPGSIEFLFRGMILERRFSQ